MDETLFGWVHISDIHFGHGDAAHGWDQELVMAALRRDIAQTPAPVHVNAILVTGDIAFSGADRSPDEYEKARAWLLEAGKAAGVGPERIFLVPGNHDVSRNADTKSTSTGRLVQDLRSRGTPGTSLDDALRSAEDRRLLAGRMEAFLDFAQAFGPWALRDPMPPAVERLYWVCPLRGRGGLRLRLVGLNSALLCKDDEDVGQLRLGKEQISKALAVDRAPEEIIMVMTHHPLRRGWLGDDGDADKWIRNNTQVHLSGHVHEAESEGSRSGAGGGFLRIVAGAAHNDQIPAWIPATHGYNFGEVRRGAAGGVVVRVHPRLWSPPNAKFVVDVHSVPEGKTFSEHALAGVALPAAPMLPATPEPIPAGPLETFISYAAEDRAALDRLNVHLKPLKREGMIASWSSAEVGAGHDVERTRAERLAKARVILLLVSADYLASDDCYDVEMQIAVARHERGEARVIPILLGGCDFWSAPFAKLRFLPKWKQEDRQAAPRPIYGFPDREVAYAEIVKDVRAEVEKLRKPG